MPVPGISYASYLIIRQSQAATSLSVRTALLAFRTGVELLSLQQETVYTIKWISILCTVHAYQWIESKPRQKFLLWPVRYPAPCYPSIAVLMCKATAEVLRRGHGSCKREVMPREDCVPFSLGMRSAMNSPSLILSVEIQLTVTSPSEVSLTSLPTCV